MTQSAIAAPLPAPFGGARKLRSAAARLVAGLSLLWLAACDLPAIGPGGNSGQQIDPDAPIPVALLLPGGTGTAELDLIARSMENAARLAIADLNGVEIDLRVFNTGRDPARSASVAAQAVNEGARIILGPLDAQSAAAVGVAVAPANVNVLAFSNNTAVAGGNVFVLGKTFDNIANRLVTYGATQGLSRFMVVHQDDIGGAAGRDAIVGAIQRNGASVIGVQAYPFSQQGIFDRASAITAAINGGGAQAVFVTDTVAGGLPVLATSMVDSGFSPSRTPMMGLSQWDASPQAMALPGLQGGYFTRPDTAREAQFNARYEAAYGSRPHPLASIAYDGIAAIGALAATGDRNALTSASLTRRAGFQGATGIFRLNPDGSNDRALSVVRLQNNTVVLVDPAPASFGAGGS